MSAPVYMKIAEDIKAQILTGHLKPGDAMPSESALCELYHVSRLTARNAMNVLHKENWIIVLPGKGAFVNEVETDCYRLYYSEMDLGNVKIDKINVIDVNIIESDRELVYYLHLHPSIRVVCIKRVLLSNQNVIGYDEKYIPYYKGLRLSENELENKTFPQMLSNKTSLYTLEKNITILAESATREIAEQLGTEKDHPVMFVQMLLSDTELGPIGLSKTYYNSHYISLKGFYEL